ncbi:penicillin-binding transpeptidase domain-containing protein [Phycisphaera mikurensis]|uniref:beta-lactamase n=1 Tax=Phycisphaera mikurensis (strain NBRC 102666 / KCTC 22515 / FYK2301M01) TaxID=1142394 RepID=I0ICI3_PHYMF|nr:penicillin-binding transpeptidase domain-containing protein [Phycisphaera mikurensis]MBB6442153.1 penicillin-binding protein 2 [Phycisphaera mikurensis]BAM02971.1 putative penicillin-binding protein [Phycisphaera mikurensis NBRC 102666]
MRSFLRQSVPSMFHRRLLLLGGLAAAVAAVLVVQAARLATGDSHRELLGEAEAAMVRESLIPTVRGRIYDRHGRVLARDEPGWSVALPYPLFTGGWAYEAASRAAEAEAGRAWRSMEEAAREAAIGPRLDGFRRQRDMFWLALPDLLRVEPAELLAARDRVVKRVRTVKAQYIGRRLQERRLETGDPDADWADIQDDTVAEELATHAIATGVPDPAATLLKELAADARAKAAAADREGATAAERAAAEETAIWREVGVERSRDRVYPRTVARVSLDRSGFPSTLASDEPVEVELPGVAVHVLGQLKPLYAGEKRLGARPLAIRGDPVSGEPADLGGYRVGDPAGHFGVERVLEPTLRGRRGKEVRRLEADADGVKRVLRTEPVAGDQVTLTLDIELQAYLEALLSPRPDVGLMTVQPWLKAEVPPGTVLTGALVVMEIATGEILGAATAPGMSRAVLEEDPAEIYQDFTFEPWTFRPTAYPRMPGSTIKPLVLAAAITDGVWGADEVMDVSSGHLYPKQPNLFRDWWQRQPGGAGLVTTLDGPTAIKISGNVFFGRLAQKLGPQRLAWWYRQLGVGEKADLPVRESAGSLFDPLAADAGPQADNTAIGQGQLSMTPAQLAAAHATLARGGRHLPPKLVRGLPARPHEGASVRFSTEAVQAALLGMWKSGNEAKGRDLTYGTTYQFSLGGGAYHRIFSVSNVNVFAKSGSAQVDGGTVEKFDEDGDGLVDRFGEVVRSGAHGWAVALVGPVDHEPLYAIVALAEHGYSGGTSAGPMVNEAIVALQKFGYLPPGASGPGAAADGPQRVSFPEAGDEPADPAPAALASSGR